MANLDVSGDVQGDAAVTINGATTVNGAFTYGTSFTDSGSNLTLTNQGKTGTPVHQAGSLPTIDYASIKALAVSTFTGGANQRFAFNHVNNGVDVFVVNGDCTDPKIDTSTTGGTILFTGNLTITKSATWGCGPSRVCDRSRQGDADRSADFERCASMSGATGCMMTRPLPGTFALGGA